MKSRTNGQRGTFLSAQFGSGLAQGRTVMTAVSAAGMLISLVLGVIFGRQFYKEVNEAPEASTVPESDVSDAAQPGKVPLTSS